MTEQTQSGISRRTLAKGAAWSVPAVAVAAAAPAYAASPRPCTASGLCFGCASVHKCCSGGPRAMYWACVTFTNNGTTNVTVSFSFTVNTSANGLVAISGGGSVPAGQTVSFKPETGRIYGNCSTGTYDSFTINFTDSLGGTGSANVPGGAIDGGGNTCPGNTTCSCTPSVTGGASRTTQTTEVAAEEPAPVADTQTTPAEEITVETKTAPAEEITVETKTSPAVEAAVKVDAAPAEPTTAPAAVETPAPTASAKAPSADA